MALLLVMPEGSNPAGAEPASQANFWINLRLCGKICLSKMLVLDENRAADIKSKTNRCQETRGSRCTVRMIG